MYKKVFIALGFCLVIVGLVGITKASIMPIKAIIGQQYLEVAWKESLRANKLSKPWKSADFYMIGKLTVPKLKISRVILNSSTGEAMAWGIGRVDNAQSSSKGGPIILAGHRDSHMQFMSKLNVGDKVELMMSNRVLKTFIISKTDITKKPELAVSALNTKNEILILTTCWPFNSQKPGSERYIVTAEKASS
ncbi:class D sortase [Amylibacter sp.]|nr:class D sortase [Amylibacter sp.]MDC0607533.1 class D sortase [Amylibacter sp.]